MTQEIRTGRVVIDGVERPPNNLQVGGGDVAGQPHHALDFNGGGVTAEDQGGGEVRIEIPEPTPGTGAPASAYQIEVPSGSWLGPQAANGLTDLRSDNNPDTSRMFFHPFIVPVNMSFDRINIAARYTRFGSLNGEQFAYGVYTHNPTRNKPANKLLEIVVTMPVGGSDISNKEQVISLPLTAGIYWFATQLGFLPGIAPLELLGFRQFGFGSGNGETPMTLGRRNGPMTTAGQAVSAYGLTATLGSWPTSAPTAINSYSEPNDPPLMVQLRRQ